MIPQVLTFSNRHCCCVVAQLSRVDFKLAIFNCSIKDLAEQVTSVTLSIQALSSRNTSVSAVCVKLIAGKPMSVRLCAYPSNVDSYCFCLGAVKM